MLIMPILNRSRNGVNRIYNVKITLKDANKVKKNAFLKNHQESDIIVNGFSYNESIYNIKGQEYNVVTNFIRSKQYTSNDNKFLITTRSNSNSKLYDLYSVSMPPRKVTSGLDKLYGRVIINMQKEIPNVDKGRCISLEEIGVCDHITNDKIELLKYIVSNASNDDNLDYLLFSNQLSSLKSTIEFIKTFDFTIIGESVLEEEKLKDVLKSLEHLNSKEYKNLNRYYNLAIDNKKCYEKISRVNKILYGKAINLIKKKEKSKVLIKTSDNMVFENDKRAA